MKINFFFNLGSRHLTLIFYFTLVPLGPKGRGAGEKKYWGRNSTAWHLPWSTGNCHPSSGYLGPGSRRVVTDSSIEPVGQDLVAAAERLPVHSCRAYWPPL